MPDLAPSRLTGRARRLDRERLRPLGQVGVGALGVLHLLIAFVAVQVAFGHSGGHSADTSGALAEVAGHSFGAILLTALGAGLAAYALWQAVEAAVGSAHEKPRRKIALRVGAGFKAAIGAALAASCLRLVAGAAASPGSASPGSASPGSAGQGSSSGQQEADLTASLMGLPAGRALVVLLGLVILGVAGYFGWRAITRKFTRKLAGRVDTWVVRLGIVGYLARGLAFGVIGVLVVLAGLQNQPQKSRGLDAALKTLAARPFGSALLTAVALGLAAFGVYLLLTARRTRRG